MILLANLHVLRLNRSIEGKGGSLVSVCEALRRNVVVDHCFNKLSRFRASDYLYGGRWG